MAGSRKIGSMYAELSLQDKLTHALNKPVKALDGFAKSAAKWGAGGAAALAAGLAVGTKRAIGMADDLADLSTQTGITMSALMKIGQAYKDNGKDAAGVGKDINKMQKALYEAATAKTDPLAEFGMSAKALMSLSPEQQFFKIGEAITAIQDPAKQTAAAMAVFGKSGGELKAVFANSSLKDIEATLGNMPGLIDQYGQSMGRANDLMDRLRVKSDQLFTGIAAGIVGELLLALEQLNQQDLSSTGKDIGTGLVDLTKIAGAAGQAIADVGKFTPAGWAFNVLQKIGVEIGKQRPVEPTVLKPGPLTESMPGLMTADVPAEKVGTLPPSLDRDWIAAAQEAAAAVQLKADAMAEYSNQLAKLNAEQSGDTAAVKALEREWELRQKIAELVKDGFTNDQATQMATALSDAQAALDAKPAANKSWESTAYQVNDYQSRGLGLGGSQTPAVEGKKITILTSIRDLIKDAARANEGQVWNL